MNPNYRTYQAEDLGTLVGLMAQLGYSHDDASLARNVGKVRKAGGEIFVAEAHGTICGCVCAIIDVRLAAGETGEIVSLVVSESYRGKGIGKGLMYIA